MTGHPAKAFSKVKFNISTRLFLSHFLVVVLICGTAGTYLYRTAYEEAFNQIRARLLSSALLVSDSLEPYSKKLQDLRKPEDSNLESYQNILKFLRQIKKRNPEFAYVYLMRKDGDIVRFVVDSDATSEQAEIGQRYEETTPALWRGFYTASSESSIVYDKWGSFLSGYAPVGDSGEYLLGVDMREKTVQEQLWRFQLTSIICLVTAVLFSLVFSHLVSGYLVRPIRSLIRNCEKVVSGQNADNLPNIYGDELGTLVTSFNRMLENLLVSREKEREAAEALRKLNKELEKRIIDRTTELTLAEKNLRELNAGKDRLFSIIAHDLNSPLQAMMGSAELLSSQINDLTPQEITEFAQKLYLSSQNLSELLNQLLSWSRLQVKQMSFQPEKLDLSELARTAAQITHFNMEAKAIRFHAKLPETCPYHGDKQMLGVVLRNLLSNAVKFTFHQGTISLTLVAEANHIRVAITDSGVGISPDRLPNLFTLKFQQSTPGTQHEPGTGLGLLLVKEMIERHGGSIAVQSEIGKGTTFTVVLPLATEIVS